MEMTKLPRVQAFRLWCAVGMALLLLGCRPVSAPDQTDAAFTSPLSNQIEAHEHSTDEESEEDHGEEDHGDHDDAHLDPALATAEMGVALVPSELVVGENRFAVGLFDAEGQVVHEAAVHFHYYDLTNPSAPVLESHGEAVRRQTPDGLTTIFAHERTFDRAGDWGVEIQVEFADGTAAIQRKYFEVLADSAAPTIGEAALRVETPTASDVESDLTRLSSALTPNPAFYTHSLTDALASGKPTVLLFATPAFCRTRFCGPAYELTGELQTRYAEAVNFVHVEVYSDLPDPAATGWQLAPAMQAYGLRTEPWLFVIGGDGTVAYRVEGLFTAEEVEERLAPLLNEAR